MVNDVFVAAKMVNAGFGSFFRDVAQEIGRDRALEIMIKQFEQFWGERAKQIKTSWENDELDLNTLAAEAEAFWRMMGFFDGTVEATPTSLVYTTNKCPFYEGFLESGVDHSTIEAYCRGKDNAGDAQSKQYLSPDAGLKLRKFRSGPDDYCIEEEVILKQ
jgi:hypothetical protein